jgi:hypothetical protein
VTLGHQANWIPDSVVDANFKISALVVNETRNKQMVIIFFILILSALMRGKCHIRHSKV